MEAWNAALSRGEETAPATLRSTYYYPLNVQLNTHCVQLKVQGEPTVTLLVWAVCSPLTPEPPQHGELDGDMCKARSRAGGVKCWAILTSVFHSKKC